MKTVATLDELINIALTKENSLVKFYMGELTKSEVLILKNTIGITLDNYAHVVDNYAIRHVMIQHGNQKKEAQKGQITVTIEDFQMIPHITKDPELITHAGVNKVGRIVVKYQKTIGDTIFYYLAEIREKHTDIAMQTMYKRKTPTMKVRAQLETTI